LYPIDSNENLKLKTIPFTIKKKGIKIGINLTKEMQKMCTNNYKIAGKKKKKSKDPSKQRVIP
jgi:hypothetical protein